MTPCKPHSFDFQWQSSHPDPRPAGSARGRKKGYTQKVARVGRKEVKVQRGRASYRLHKRAVVWKLIPAEPKGEASHFKHWHTSVPKKILNCMNNTENKQHGGAPPT